MRKREKGEGLTRGVLLERHSDFFDDVFLPAATLYRSLSASASSNCLIALKDVKDLKNVNVGFSKRPT